MTTLTMCLLWPVILVFYLKVFDWLYEQAVIVYYARKYNGNTVKAVPIDDTEFDRATNYQRKGGYFK